MLIMGIPTAPLILGLSTEYLTVFAIIEPLGTPLSLSRINPESHEATSVKLSLLN